jgi:hypothetical protein
MEIKVQITVKSQAGEPELIQEVVSLKRGPLRPETLGLSLAEARSILAGLEQTMVEQQATEFVTQEGLCCRCGRQRTCKGHHPIVFRTPFGKVTLDSPRLYPCPCESEARKSFSPLAELLAERTSPELIYLETKFAALVSYGLTIKLLQEVLPIGQALNTRTVRRHVRHTAERLESERGDEPEVFPEACLQDRSALPEPSVPQVVGLDGVYVHAKGQRSRTEGWFEVIVGKRLATEEQAAQCFGFVSRYEPEPKGRLFDWLKTQGLHSDQVITFLSDGGDTVRELPRGFTPQAEYVLDWFHVTMRVTTMGRMAKGVQAEGYPELSADLEDMLEHLKWNLWHGKVDRALEILDELAYALDVEDASPEHRKLLKAVRSFETYVTNNRAFIPNYGERYRQGKIIATSFVESAVNQVVSKRFVKKQQMRWTEAGAHLLLQIRIQVLNGAWRSTLSACHVGLRATPKAKAA